MNADNNQARPGEVKAVSSTRQHIVEIHLGRVIHPSAVHPFYVPGKGWTHPAELLGATSEDAAVSNPNSGEQSMPDQPHPAAPITGFVAGTPILTPEGSKPIENIKPGDLIQTHAGDCEDNHEPEDHDDDHTGEGARWWEWN